MKWEAENQVTIFDVLDSSVDGNLIHGDSLEEMKNLESGTIDLIITSPPYNIGKEYENKLSIAEYKE